MDRQPRSRRFTDKDVEPLHCYPFFMKACVTVVFLDDVIVARGGREAISNAVNHGDRCNNNSWQSTFMYKPPSSSKCKNFVVDSCAIRRKR